MWWYIKGIEFNGSECNCELIVNTSDATLTKIHEELKLYHKWLSLTHSLISNVKCFDYRGIFILLSSGYFRRFYRGEFVYTKSLTSKLIITKGDFYDYSYQIECIKKPVFVIKLYNQDKKQYYFPGEIDHPSGFPVFNIAFAKIPSILLARVLLNIAKTKMDCGFIVLADKLSELDRDLHIIRSITLDSAQPGSFAILQTMPANSYFNYLDYSAYVYTFPNKKEEKTLKPSIF